MWQVNGRDHRTGDQHLHLDGMKSEALPPTIEIIDVDFQTVVSAVERD